MRSKYLLYLIIGLIALRYGLKQESREEKSLPPNLEGLKNKTFSAGTILEIKRIDAKVLQTNGIGNEWSFHSDIGGSRVFTNQSFTIDLSGRKKMDIKSTAIDHDPTYDDVGIKTREITPQNLSGFLEAGRITETVEVFEYHGPGAGKSAICQFVYEIKRKGDKEEP